MRPGVPFATANPEALMKLKSPIVTLFVGLLLAVATWVLSVSAHEQATTPEPTPTTDQYGAATMGASR
jgi:hypothetical protein